MRTTKLKELTRRPSRDNLKFLRRFAAAFALAGLLVTHTGCAAIAEGIVEGIGDALVDGVLSGVGEGVGDDDSCHDRKSSYAHYERSDGGATTVTRDPPGRGR